LTIKFGYVKLEHPLVAFIYEAFGKQFGDLLLVGYGREPTEQEASFEFTETGGEGTDSWTVEVRARPLPGGKEPLVLAALLKFLLLRIDLDDESHVSPSLEFNMQALLEEVGRDGTLMSAAEVEEIIDRYVKISYVRNAQPQEDEVNPRERTKGQYRLVVGYTTLTYKDEGDERRRRLVDRVDLILELVEGLKGGEITFAGMKLGERQPGKPFPNSPFMPIL
jgi:hypothetical protein